MFLAHPPSSTPAASSLYITSVPVRVCVVLLSCYPFSRFCLSLSLSLSYGLFSSVNFRFLFNLVSASTFLSLQPLGRSSIHHTPLRLFLHLKEPTKPPNGIMYSKTILVAALLAVAEARFGEEGKVQTFIQALGQFGNPGQAATLAGQTPSVLLAGANACAKVGFTSPIEVPPASLLTHIPARPCRYHRHQPRKRQGRHRCRQDSCRRREELQPLRPVHPDPLR